MTGRNFAHTGRDHPQLGRQLFAPVCNPPPRSPGIHAHCVFCTHRVLFIHSDASWSIVFDLLCSYSTVHTLHFSIQRRHSGSMRNLASSTSARSIPMPVLVSALELAHQYLYLASDQYKHRSQYQSSTSVSISAHSARNSSGDRARPDGVERIGAKGKGEAVTRAGIFDKTFRNSLPSKATYWRNFKFQEHLRMRRGSCSIKACQGFLYKDAVRDSSNSFLS